MSERALGDRRRLRPWLERLLNSNEIPGLHWIDDGKRTKFRIPWPHSGRKGWQPIESKVFMGWAQQNGRYREGIDKPDYVKWKTQLRCALNKAQDIEYLASESLENKDDSNSFRIYVFKNISAEPKERRHDAFSRNGTSFPVSSQPVYSNIPGFVTQMHDEDSSLPSDLENLPMTEHQLQMEGTFSDLISKFIGNEDVKSAFNSGSNDLAQVTCGGGVRSTVGFPPAPATLSYSAGVNDVMELADNIKMMSVEEGCDPFERRQCNGVAEEDMVDGPVSTVPIWPPIAHDVTTQGNLQGHVSCVGSAQFSAIEEACQLPVGAAASIDDEDLDAFLANLYNNQKRDLGETSGYCQFELTSPEEVPFGLTCYRRNSQNSQHHQQLRQRQDQFAVCHHDNTALLFSMTGIQYSQQTYQHA